MATYRTSDMGQTIVTLTREQQTVFSRFIAKTYGWMTAGLALTGFISFGIATSEPAVQYILQNAWLVKTALVVELLVVLALSFAAPRLPAAMVLLGFLFYAALNGLVFSTLFLIYTMSSIAQIFFITSGMFGGLALFGTVTKRDLTGVGSFVGMGLWGLILVGLVNIFVQSNALSMGLSAAGVIIFTGLTAWDAQRIRAMAFASASSGLSHEEAQKGSIFAALTLYLNFINLFLSLLRLFGSRRD